MASVDRDWYGLGIEPRKALNPECRRREIVRKATSHASPSRDACGLRAVADPMHVSKLSVRNPGDPAVGLDPSSRSAWSRIEVQP